MTVKSEISISTHPPTHVHKSDTFVFLGGRGGQQGCWVQMPPPPPPDMSLVTISSALVHCDFLWCICFSIALQLAANIAFLVY